MSSARAIWILFGNMHEVESERPRLEAIYRRNQQMALDKGYSLGFSQLQGTSTQALIRLMKDPVTYMLIWHSHGDGGGGIWPAGATTPLNPGGLGRAGPNVKKVALWSCAAGKGDWRNTLGISYELNQVNFLAPPFFIYPSAKKGWKTRSKVDEAFAMGANASSFYQWIKDLPKAGD